MSNQKRILELVGLLEKVRTQKLGEDWQFKMELIDLENKIIAEIRRLQQELQLV